MSDLKTKLREKTLKRPSAWKKEIVEFEGEQFEVRQPSVAQRGAILDKAMIPVDKAGEGEEQKIRYNSAMLQTWATICCTFVPDTDEAVFGPEDEKEMLAQPAGGYVDEFGNAALKLMNVDKGDVEKNS